ncbi:MAG: hypothetical protein ACOX3C_02025 [Bacilli bacterium]
MKGEEYRGVYYTEYRYTNTDSTAGCFNATRAMVTQNVVFTGLNMNQ